ncbi:hypothetical protein EVAR_95595_1 [Eumeta japonica]|uniref:Uncharacterized protein n=1 Tax=Eumeta variegata TaxID=151549 RepID=A0A4C1VJ20_EUMVA|nr:hypothetical protein EVAR_95595_1 [Eumeta japonica]
MNSGQKQIVGDPDKYRSLKTLKKKEKKKLRAKNAALRRASAYPAPSKSLRARALQSKVPKSVNLQWFNSRGAHHAPVSPKETCIETSRNSLCLGDPSGPPVEE